MLRGNKIEIVFLWVVMTCLSCEKSIDYQLQNQSSSVVMYAFPMPDSTLKIHGSSTTNILSLNDFEGIEDMNLNVFLDDNLLVDVPYPFGAEWFDVNEVIGYESKILKVIFELADGRIVSGSTTIPEAVGIISIDTSYVTVINSENIEENMLRCFVELNDPPNTLNYYQIRVDSKKWLINQQNDTIQKTETIEYVKEDKVFLIRNDESVLLSEVDFQGTFNDFLFDGTNYKVKLLIPEEWLVKDSGEIKNELCFYLYSLTSDYYDFIRSSIAEEAYRKFPFFEQVNVYSNVNNGLGVVAGLSVDIDSVLIFNETIEPI